MLRHATPRGPAAPARTALLLTWVVAAFALGVPTAQAASGDELRGALDGDPAVVSSVDVVGDPVGTAVGSAPIDGFPTHGGNYAVISTGNASALPGDPAAFVSSDLAGSGGADGHDLTQIKLNTLPPANATCVAFDFAFLSEEYPEYVGSAFNDIFTAELNDTFFSVSNGQVVAPNNFAYDSKNNPVSINTVFGLSQVPGTTMDGATPALTATSPIKRYDDAGHMTLILSVQDLGDNAFDSAVIIDNLRFGNGANCSTGTTELTDTDADGLPDDWETNGVDTDKNGTVDLDLPAMGADPNHKDIFIEVDHMVKPDSCVWFVCWGGRDFAPMQSALNDVRAAFANSPVTNPDHTTGVRMHIDSGPGSVMNPVSGATWGSRSRADTVPFAETLGTANGFDYHWDAVNQIKTGHLDVARREAFHYVIYADMYATPKPGSSGISRGLPGSDILLTDGHSSWGDGGFTRTQERGTFMHELGHGLGLMHGGDIADAHRPGYLSIMSYAYQLPGLPPNAGLDYSRSSPFNDWTHLKFDGGSIGARGDTATLPDSTDTSEELDAQQLKTEGHFAAPGDGTVSFAGPTVLLPASGPAALLYDVTNSGSVDAAYTLTVSSPLAQLNATPSVNVPAGQTVRVSVPVDTAALTPGETTVTATLSSALAGPDLSTTTDEITVPDLNDPAVKQAAQAARDQLAALPEDSTLDPAARAQVITAITTATEPPPPPPPAKAWTATLTLTGKGVPLLTSYTTKLSVVTLPTTAAPRKIELRSAKGERRLVLSAVSLSRTPTRFLGALVFSTGSTDTPTIAFQASSWNASTKTLTGLWVAGARKLGVFTLKLKAP